MSPRFRTVRDHRNVSNGLGRQEPKRKHFRASAWRTEVGFGKPLRVYPLGTLVYARREPETLICVLPQ